MLMMCVLLLTDVSGWDFSPGDVLPPDVVKNLRRGCAAMHMHCPPIGSTVMMKCR